ncbi:MAG: glucose-6-phosphate dehydrogenase [Myxococcota bacterium]
MATPDQVIIFGASGDLTSRKLIPALLNNHIAGALKRPIQVIGVARSTKTHEQWRQEMGEALAPELREAYASFSSQLYWVRANAADSNDLHELGEFLDRLTEEAGGTPDQAGRLFYLALGPNLFGRVVSALSSQNLIDSEPGATDGWRRVVVEKPFGTDLPSAQALNRTLLQHLREDQLFRIDHYLGKETVQNILSFRFQNAIFEPLWNRQHIESVEISVCEKVAMEGERGAYYDKAGALRDMVQNHLLQVLALVAMEAPGTLSADDVRNEKTKVFRALRRFTANEVKNRVIRAQYIQGPGRERDYREEPGVDPESQTETYVAIRAAIDNWRWSEVPFLLRTGKALEKRFTQIVLNFRTPPVDLLNGPLPEGVCALRPNALTLRIQPDEGVSWSFLVKEPGAGMVMRQADLGFRYADLGVPKIPDAYQRLLLDALEGNATLFLRGDEVEAAWSFVDAIHAGWAEGNAPIWTYPAGGRGPDEADALFVGCEGIWSRGP